MLIVSLAVCDWSEEDTVTAPVARRSLPRVSLRFSLSGNFVFSVLGLQVSYVIKKQVSDKPLTAERRVERRKENKETTDRRPFDSCRATAGKQIFWPPLSDEFYRIALPDGMDSFVVSLRSSCWRPVEDDTVPLRHLFSPPYDRVGSGGGEILPNFYIFLGER
jgi:hypothetical protein